MFWRKCYQISKLSLVKKSIISLKKKYLNKQSLQLNIGSATKHF